MLESLRRRIGEIEVEMVAGRGAREEESWRREAIKMEVLEVLDRHVAQL